MAINYCVRCGTAMEDQFAFGKIRRVCPHCGYVHFQDPKVAAVTFVQKDHQVLLIQRAVNPEKGKWALPAGFVNGTEDPKQAAIRETAEETGLDIEIVQLLDVIHNPPIDGMKGASIIIIYAGVVVGGELKAMDDAADAGWFLPEELPELAFASTHLIIDQWLNMKL